MPGSRASGKPLALLRQFRLHVREFLPRRLQAPFHLGDFLVPGGEIVGRPTKLALQPGLTAPEVLAFPLSGDRGRS